MTRFHVGDRFRIGTAVFEVTQPRVPCYKLAIKDGNRRLLQSAPEAWAARILFSSVGGR